MAEHSDRVGVVVLNYRGADDTIACVQSLRTLNTPARIVVVDNGSGDGSAELISAALPDVELIANATNLGFGAGNNVAIGGLLADGVEFVWLLNNDTTVEPGTLDALLAEAATGTRIGAVGSVIYDKEHRDEVLTWGGGSVSPWSGRTTDARRSADRVDYITGASMLLRAEALREVGTFDARFFFTWEDVDLCTRLDEHGWNISVATRSRVWHRWGGTVAPLAPQRLEHHAAGAVLFMRKHSRLPWLTALPLLGYYALTSLRQQRLTIWRASWRGWRRGWKS